MADLAFEYCHVFKAFPSRCRRPESFDSGLFLFPIKKSAGILKEPADFFMPYSNTSMPGIGTIPSISSLTDRSASVSELMIQL